MLKKIKTGNLTTTVQEQIKTYIAESGLKPGSILPTEKVLEEQLGISRTSIREALRSLEALGIVETRHGVGRFLREFNFDAILDSLSFNIQVNVKDFRQMINVRIALESTFLKWVTPEMTDDDIQDLYEILYRMENEVQHDLADEDLIRVHTEFHLKLYEKAQNELLDHLIRLFATMQRTLTFFRKYRTSDKAEFIDLHRSLIVALESRDIPLVEKTLVDHFKDVIAWSDANKDTTF